MKHVARIIVYTIITVCVTGQVQVNAENTVKAQTKSGKAQHTVIVDPRIELLSVVQHLSDYEGYNGNPVHNQLEFPYKKNAIEYFSSFKSHKAVQLFDEMSGKGFWYSQPPEAMLSYTDPPDLTEIHPVSDFILQRAGGRDKLDEFIEQLRQFAVESDFMTFFHAQEKEYEKMLADYLKSVGEWSYLDDLHAFYGYSHNSYTIIVAPFFHSGGFGSNIAAGNGLFNIYNLSGPWNYENGTYFFGEGQFFRRLVWHEFSHSYVNQQTSLYMDSLTGPVEILQPDMKAKIDAMPNVTWDLFVDEWASEIIVRAVTTYLAYTKLGTEEGDAALQSETRRGYPYVKEFCDKIGEYNSNRDKYKTFPDFFPELVAVFQELAAQKEQAK